MQTLLKRKEGTEGRRENTHDTPHQQNPVQQHEPALSVLPDLRRLGVLGFPPAQMETQKIGDCREGGHANHKPPSSLLASCMYVPSCSADCTQAPSPLPTIPVAPTGARVLPKAPASSVLGKGTPEGVAEAVSLSTMGAGVAAAAAAVPASPADTGTTPCWGDGPRLAAYATAHRSPTMLASLPRPAPPMEVGSTAPCSHGGEGIGPQ